MADTFTKYEAAGEVYDTQKEADAAAKAANDAALQKWARAVAEATQLRTGVPKGVEPNKVFPDPTKPQPVSATKQTYEYVWDVIDSRDGALVVVGVPEDTANSEVTRLNAEANGERPVTINVGSPDASNPAALDQSQIVVTTAATHQAVRREQRVDA